MRIRLSVLEDLDHSPQHTYSDLPCLVKGAGRPNDSSLFVEARASAVHYQLAFGHSLREQPIGKPEPCSSAGLFRNQGIQATQLWLQWGFDAPPL